MKRPCYHRSVNPTYLEGRPEHIKNKYNSGIHTNATVKHPNHCPNGRKHCRLCSIGHLVKRKHIRKQKYGIKIDY